MYQKFINGDLNNGLIKSFRTTYREIFWLLVQLLC